MNRLFAVSMTLLLSLWATAWSKPPYENIDNTQLKTLIAQGVPLYDIRRPEEWKQTGVIEGSRLLTWVDRSGQVAPGFFDKLAAEAPKDRPVAIICRTGNRTSQLARELMEKHGYTRVYNVRNGIVGWIAEGNQVVHLWQPLRRKDDTWGSKD